MFGVLGIEVYVVDWAVDLYRANQLPSIERLASTPNVELAKRVIAGGNGSEYLNSLMYAACLISGYCDHVDSAVMNRGKALGRTKTREVGGAVRVLDQETRRRTLTVRTT